jgi:hypothetical protein
MVRPKPLVERKCLDPLASQIVMGGVQRRPQPRVNEASCRRRYRECPPAPNGRYEQRSRTVKTRDRVNGRVYVISLLSVMFDGVLKVESGAPRKGLMHHPTMSYILN